MTQEARPQAPFAAAVEQLSLCLWQLRELLGELIYRQEVQRLLLAAGSVRFLPKVAGEIEEVVARIVSLDALRAQASLSVTSQLGLHPDASLLEIAEQLGADAAGALHTHLASLRALQAEVASLQQVNVDMSHRGVQAARELVDALGGSSVQTYSAHGTPNRVVAQASRLDTSL